MISNTRKCWLHVGVPKTGTTALQHFLAANRESLAVHGFAYPRTAERSGGHHDLAFLCAGGYPHWATPQDRSLAHLEAELIREFATEFGDVVFSSENFYLLCDPQAVAQLMARLGFGPGQVRVVVYLRRQDEVVASWYNQAIKAQGYAGTLDDHITTHQALWDYATQVERWAAAFGADSLVIRTYEMRDMVGGDVCRDFMNTLGLPGDGFVFSNVRSNTHINRDILEFQRQVNRLPLTPQRKRHFHKELIALTAATKDNAIFNDEPLLGPERRRQLLDGYAEGNAALARRWFGRDRLFNEVLPPVEPQAVMSGMTAEKLTCIIGWLLIGVDDETKGGCNA